MKVKFNRYRDGWDEGYETLQGTPIPAPSGEAAVAAEELIQQLTKAIDAVEEQYPKLIIIDLDSKLGKQACLPIIEAALQAFGDRCRRGWLEGVKTYVSHLSGCRALGEPSVRPTPDAAGPCDCGLSEALTPPAEPKEKK